ncbi:MAG: hypothetical protein NVSMB26_04050 [Beijerinckiaceae bacterium]
MSDVNMSVAALTSGVMTNYFLYGAPYVPVDLGLHFTDAPLTYADWHGPSSLALVQSSFDAYNGVIAGLQNAYSVMTLPSPTQPT